MKNSSIAFIGAGNLAQALIGGLLSTNYDPKKIWAADPFADKVAALQQHFGIGVAASNGEAVNKSQVVVLAVKPDQVRKVCEEIREQVLSKQVLVISVAAGVTLPLLQKWLSPQVAMVRAMPNTPVMVGAGLTGLFPSHEVGSAQKDLTETLFRAVGIILWLEEEKHIDLICAISGCGPGYLFLMMEAIADTAKKQGLSDSVARLLTSQTFLGSARLALESKNPLTELRRQVTSPGGVTEKIISLLEAGGIRGLLESAIEEAVKKSEAISRELSAL